MKKTLKTFLSVITVITFLLVIPAMVQATLITTQPAGTTTVLTTVTGTWGYAPSVVAGGFTVFAPSGSDVWYGDSSYGLADNGTWGGFAWVGGYCYSGACTATIDLGGSYSDVGGFMNYALSGGAPSVGSGGNPLLEAIAADGTTILESYDIFASAPITTPSGYNDGAFRGISRGIADIAYLRFSGSYLLMHDLTLGEAATVPEPATLLLLGSGLVGLVYARRRMKK